MSFNVASLTNYVNEQSTDLISRLYFEKTSSDYFTLQSGVKKTDALHLLAVTAFPQDGSGCSPTASGDVVFSQQRYYGRSNHLLLRFLYERPYP
jgi:hypothetical protein